MRYSLENIVLLIKIFKFAIVHIDGKVYMIVKIYNINIILLI